MNAALSDVVSEFSDAVMIVDEDSALGKDAANWSSDEEHPNDQGHAIIAEAAYQTLVNAPPDVQKATFGLETGNPSNGSIITTNWAVNDQNYQSAIEINTTPVNPGGLPNLITNPSFEHDLTGWSSTLVTTSASINRTTAAAYSGSASLR